MSDIVKLLLERGLVEVTDPKTTFKSKYGYYALYLPEHEKVWTGSSRALRTLIHRWSSWTRSAVNLKLWAHGVHALLGESRQMRLFIHPERFVHPAVDEALRGALIPRKALVRGGAVNIWRIERRGEPFYRLISNRNETPAEFVLSAFLSFSKSQAQATHKARDLKFRNWCVSHKKDLPHPRRFKIEKLASFADTREGQTYMNDYIAEHGKETCLNLITRIR